MCEQCAAPVPNSVLIDMRMQALTKTQELRYTFLICILHLFSLRHSFSPTSLSLSVQPVEFMIHWDQFDPIVTETWMNFCPSMQNAGQKLHATETEHWLQEQSSKFEGLYAVASQLKTKLFAATITLLAPPHTTHLSSLVAKLSQLGNRRLWFD